MFPSTSSISPKMALINDDFPDPTVPTTATKLFSWIQKKRNMSNMVSFNLTKNIMMKYLKEKHMSTLLVL